MAKILLYCHMQDNGKSFSAQDEGFQEEHAAFAALL